MSISATFDSSLVSESLSRPIDSYNIQGQMLSVNYQISEFDMVNTDTDAIKEKLARMIADELLKSKHIEFTSQHEATTGNRMFRARIYAVPDSQVRVLRVAKIG